MSDTTQNPAAATTETVAAVTFNQKLGNAEFTFVVQSVEGRKKKDGTTPTHTIVEPVLTNNTEVLGFVSALLAAADSVEAGNGLKLFKHLTSKHFRDSTVESLDKEGNLDDGAYVNRLALTRSKRGGKSADELNAQLNEAVERFLVLKPLLDGNAGDPGRAAALAAVGVSSEEDLAHAAFRANELMRETHAIIKQRQAEAEAKDAKRKAKEAEAKAAAKSSAPAN